MISNQKKLNFRVVVLILIFDNIKYHLVSSIINIILKLTQVNKKNAKAEKNKKKDLSNLSYPYLTLRFR